MYGQTRNHDERTAGGTAMLRHSLVGLMALVVALLLASPAAAGEAEEGTDPGRFTVEITPDREDTLSAGDEVAYAISVTNEGEALDEMRVVQMLPAGFEHVSADPEGEVQGSQHVWTLELDAGETASLTHTVRAGSASQVEGGRLVQVEQEDAPAASGGEQFSSTVCVYESAGGDAAACASAWQQLESEGGGLAAWLWGIGGAVVVAALAVLAFFWLRKKPGKRSKGKDGEKTAAAV